MILAAALFSLTDRSPTMHQRLVHRALPQLVLTLLLALLAARSATAQVEAPMLSPPGDEVEVEVSFLLIDLLRVLDSEQAVEADLAYRLKWKDERLADPDARVRWVDLDDIWHPKLQPAAPRTLNTLFADNGSVDAEGNVTVVQRMIGLFGAPMNLAEFPFDEQTFQFSFVFMQPRGTRIIPIRGDIVEVTKTPTIPDWSVGTCELDLSPTVMSSALPPLPSATFTIEAKRNRNFYLTKMIFPLFIIVMMSWTVFWAPHAQINIQFGFAATSILTVIAYRFALASQLPPVPYSTRLDTVLNGCFIMSFLALVEVVVTARLLYREKPKLAEQVDVFCRVAAPAALAALAFYSFKM